MLAEIAVCRMRTGTVTIQLAAIIPQLNPVDFRAFNAGGDLVAGHTQARDGARRKIFLAAPESSLTSKLLEHGAGNQVFIHKDFLRATGIHFRPKTENKKAEPRAT